MSKFIIGLLLTINLSLSGNTYYVATNGSNSNPGTISQPFATWEKLSSVMVAGDIAYIRGGIYRSTKGSAAEEVCRWENLNGTADNPIKIWAYPGESPVLNLDNITMTSTYCYIVFIKNCNYLWVKGLRITGLKQTPNQESMSGMAINGSSNNTIENCEIDHLGMYGMSFGSGSDYNYIKNCDVHHLADIYSGNGGANGFSRTGGSTASHLTFYGCRAWLCSDDGWDLFKSDGYITIDNCWAFWNGYLDESKNDAVGGDGVGFKLGPGANKTVNATRIVTNCLAVENKEWGFNQNVESTDASFASHIYNNVAYKNGNSGFVATWGPGGDADIFRNNIAFLNNVSPYVGDIGDTQDHNSWNGDVTVTNADFLSLDASQLISARKADGSLPDIALLHLAPGSDLIDKGIDVGLSFNGNAPDLGAFETGSDFSAPSTPSYISSIIENSTPSLLEMTYNLALASIVPAVSAFSVQVNSSARSINSVSISGTKVLLNLSSPVAYGNSVTVAYTAPSSNPLQTSAGGKATSFTAQTVTNKVNPPPPNPVYVSSAIENSTPSVLEMTYNLSLANIVPAASAFSVQVNSSARGVNSVSISGTKVLLTLSSAVANGNTVTVAYTVPSSNPLQTSAGGKAASIAAQAVTNRVNPPASPVYVSSAIENSTPSVLEMTYNLSLANIVPAPSAFSVQVNSALRSINSVSVSGTKVRLTLASPVINGNVVTVAYSVPSSNPLQTAAGGKAASIGAQSVSNHVNPVTQPVPANVPPVVVVNYIPENKAGFVSELNASGSYDSNKDNLTFTWKVPANIPVSATNSSILEFLAPVSDVNQNYEFTLIVSDGKTSQSKIIPVEIIPYEPTLEAAEVKSIAASGFQSPYLPSNVLDGNIGTMWSANGIDQWLLLELKESFNIQHIKIAFQPGQKKEFYFDILGSVDKEVWEPILVKSNSCAFSGNLQVFEFPTSKTTKEYNYIKLVGKGNSADAWNYVAEFRIFGFRHRNPPEYEEQIVKVFPNPAHELVNIRIDEQTFVPDFIKIASLTGKILFQDKIGPDVRLFQAPINLMRGIYIIQMGMGEITMFTQKLIVN